MDAPRDNRPSARAAVALFAVAAALLFCARQFVVVRDDWLTLWQLAQEIVLFGLPWAAYYQLKPDAKPFTRMARVPRIGTCVAAALAALIGLEYFSGLDALWVTLLTRLGLNLDTLSQWLAADTGMDMPTALLIMAAAPALFEELSFRGLTLPALERYGAGRAAVISGLLFALTHMSLPGLPTHLLLGVALAMLAIASDSLVLPMVYHFAHNAGAVAVSYFVQYDTDVALREMISRETTLTVFIQTAVSFALWGLMMRMVFTGASRGRGEQAAEAVKAARFPRGLMIVIILLVLLLLSVYALQLIALM
jgi:membrane protease YdiL (CAAX protease family)